MSRSGSRGGSSPCDDDGQSRTTDGSPCVGEMVSVSPFGVVGASVYVNGVFTEDSDSEAWEFSDMVKCKSVKSCLCTVAGKSLFLNAAAQNPQEIVANEQAPSSSSRSACWLHCGTLVYPPLSLNPRILGCHLTSLSPVRVLFA